MMAPKIVIDSEENDDWMKSLPGYQREVALHDELAAKHSKESDVSASVIIAFSLIGDQYFQSIQKQISGVVEETPHITLLYLGMATDLEKLGVYQQDLVNALDEFGMTQAPIEGEFTGIATFDKSDDGIPLVMLYDSPQLPYLRVRLHEFLKQRFHLQLLQDHGFIPHATIAYVDSPNKIDYESNHKRSFNTIALWWGFEHFYSVLSGKVVEKELPIDEKSKSRLIDIRIGMFGNDSDTLAERMYTGEISIGQWEESMRKLIRELNSSVAAISKGGWDQMTAVDWGRLGTPNREQYNYLHGFAQTISDDRDTISLAAIKARARMYGNSSRHAAALIQAGHFLEKTLPWLPGDGTTRCLVNCKCHWELEIIEKTKNYNTVQATWKLGAAEHCDDCVDREDYVYVMQVPKDTEVPAVIGGY